MVFVLGKALFLVILSIVIFTVPYPAFSASDTIKAYMDSGLIQEAAVFPDGAKVYVTVTDGIMVGGNTTISVTNNENPPENIVVEVSDNGTFYDKIANDGIYSGMFIVTTKLTISPSNAPSNEDLTNTTAYKIVKNLHIDDKDTALIEADLDGDGAKGTSQISLITLFDVRATAITNASAKISWYTGDSGYSRVDYGLTDSYGMPVTKEEPVKDLRLFHEVDLENLLPDTTYHYMVSTTDNYGVSRVSDDYTFTTINASKLENITRSARLNKDLPKIYYVKVDGNDSKDGLTIDTAWQHPSYATQKADAGDTIYLVEGAWNNERLVFARSGIDVAPITLTTYNNGMSTLYENRTGYGIQIKGKSYINISGIRFNNYSTALSIRGNATGIKVSDFIVENIRSTGIMFDGGTNKVSEVSLSNFEMTNVNQTSISYGGASNLYGIEMNNFIIHDTTGSGIYMRHIDRLHINNGTIRNITDGSDGAIFSLNTYNSIMENLLVANVHWHGVAVHDWTVGMNPAFNNIIRNSEIINASHNHIDLHSGAYNTLVENNILHHELTFSTAIYFHNRGAGLVARNNTIYNTSRAFSGGGYAQFPLHDIFIQNNTIHDCYSSCVDMGNDKITITGNRIYNQPGGDAMSIGSSNVVIEDNDVDEGKTYRINYGANNTIMNPRDSMYYVRSTYGSNVTFEYTDGRVYNQELTYKLNFDGIYSPPPKFAYSE